MAQKHLEQLYRMRSLSEELASECGHVMPAFVEFQARALATDALSSHVKRLMALGIAIALHCDGCISTYVHDALGVGATRNEILETIEVAVLMGGAPALTCGNEALEALNQL